MSRRNRATKRDVLPDAVYGSEVITKLINQVMLDGKKSIAEKIVYSAMEKAANKLNVPKADDVFSTALQNVMPDLETKGRRVGGATYQVPIEIRAERKQTLAIRWIVNAARKRNERDMDNKLAGELVDAYNSTGGAFKKKEEMARTAEANKAYAHYRY